MVKIVGADIGNDSLKLVFDLTHAVRIKNAVLQRMKQEARKNLNITEPGRITRQQILRDLDVEITSKQVNGRYFVGELASKNGEAEIETGTPKADNPLLLIPLITALALEVSAKQTEGVFKLVVGLPIAEYTQDRDKYKEMILGSYDVTFRSGLLEGRQVRVLLDDVIVVPEGVAVVMNQLLNDTATGFRNSALRKGQIGVIDIGAFTTDIPIIVDGKPDSDVSEGITEGIANYLDRIVRYINETYSVRMSRSQLVERLESGMLEISIKGNLVNLKPFVDEQFEIFAAKIVSKVDSLWSNRFEIQNFFVVGGGAKALKAPLVREMQKRGIHLTFIEDEDPQMQNALGYWKLAKRQFGG